MTAEEYKASLLPEGRKYVTWTMETFSVYVNLLYPHITVVPGQEWKGAKSKYRFHCSKHGEFPQLVEAGDMLTASRGCHCRGCSSESKAKSAGKVRKPHATQAERDRAKELHADGLSYAAIGRELGRSDSTIRKWIDPKAHEDSINYNREWNKNNIERARASVKRYFQFDHGRAMRNAISAQRRARFRNIEDYVIIDDECIDVDKDLTWSLFKDVLLPPAERKEIQELYLECQYLTETTGIEHHVDHIQPLAKGGEHRMVNLQIITAEENWQKNNTFRIEDQALLAKRLFNIN